MSFFFFLGGRAAWNLEISVEANKGTHVLFAYLVGWLAG
jgi:hypothetical protein